jgi:hypothetical protein
VTPTEAYLTFSYFWIMLIMAFIADKANSKRNKARLDDEIGVEAHSLNTSLNHSATASKRMHPAESYSAIETYNHLMMNELGKKDFKTE